MGSAAFESACSELERSASMERWAARGTLQLALMEAGLEPAHVTPTQLVVVVDRLLPRQLQSYTVENVPALCARIRDGLAMIGDNGVAETAEKVFDRLGG